MAGPGGPLPWSGGRPTAVEDGTEVPSTGTAGPSRRPAGRARVVPWPPDGRPVGSEMGRGGVLCLGHAVRRFTLGAGPMRRTTDRLHLLLRLVLAVVLVSSPAVGLAAATAARGALSQQAAADVARLHEVDAVLEVGASGTAGGSVWVDAGWTAPTGRTVQGRVPAPVGTDAGETVGVWVASTGERETAPLTPSDVGLRSATIGLASALGVALTAVLGHLGGVALLDRSRARRWADGWAEVEPVWRRQLLP